MLRRWLTVLLGTTGLALVGIGVARVLATASGGALNSATTGTATPRCTCKTCS